MKKTVIDYNKLVDEAMFLIVKKSLALLATHNQLGNHHFLISFLTSYPGVVLSEEMKNIYPEEMTIVLQYQFENLHVKEEEFSVDLSFAGIRENITIPYASLTAFADPSEKFGLQFNHAEDQLKSFPKKNNQNQLDYNKVTKKDNDAVPITHDNIIKLDFKNKSIIT